MMRKFYSFFLSCVSLWAQSITITGPSEVEVGKPYTYKLKFNPAPGQESYEITKWEVQVDWLSGGTIPGSIAGESSPYYVNNNPPGGGTLTIPIQRGNLDKNKHFQIDLDDQLDSGNYFLECTDQKGNKEITQIILNR